MLPAAVFDGAELEIYENLENDAKIVDDYWWMVISLSLVCV